MREERGKPIASSFVEEAVGATLAHRRDVSDGNGEEVEDVSDGCTMKVTVRFDAVVECDDGVVNRGRQFLDGDALGVVDRVAGGAVHLRRASNRVGVLDTQILWPCVAGDEWAVL